MTSAGGSLRDSTGARAYASSLCTAHVMPSHRHPFESGRAVPPIPRLGRTPGMAGKTDLSDRSREVLTEAGLSPEEIDAALPAETANETSVIPF